VLQWQNASMKWAWRLTKKVSDFQSLTYSN
jgi:hypothetical protein